MGVETDLSWGRELLKAIDAMNLTIVSTREPTYRPSDSKKIPKLLDFGIMKNILKNFCRTDFVVYLELSSDSPVIIIIVKLSLQANLVPFTTQTGLTSRSY